MMIIIVCKTEGLNINALDRETVQSQYIFIGLLSLITLTDSFSITRYYITGNVITLHVKIGLYDATQNLLALTNVFIISGTQNVMVGA